MLTRALIRRIVRGDGGDYGSFWNYRSSGYELLGPRYREHGSVTILSVRKYLTGSSEVIARFGTPAQKKKYLVPLLNGEIRSSFSMTEYGSGFPVLYQRIDVEPTQSLHPMLPI